MSEYDTMLQTALTRAVQYDREKLTAGGRVIREALEDYAFNLKRTPGNRILNVTAVDYLTILSYMAADRRDFRSAVGLDDLVTAEALPEPAFD